MSIYDNWPDPALRMRNVDEPAIPPRAVAPGRVPPDPRIELARKAVRVRSLTDPLGAMGFRESRPRIAKEGRLRRIAVAGSILSFAGSFGFIVWSANASTGAADPNGNGAIQSAALPSETPTVVTASDQPSQLINTDRASLNADQSLTTPTPSATATVATKTAVTSTKKTSAKKTPTATATDTPEPTDTPVSSHVRSHSSG